MQVDYRLADLGSSTRLEYYAEIDTSPLRGAVKLAIPLARVFTFFQLRYFMRNLKRLAEAGSRAPKPTRAASPAAVHASASRIARSFVDTRRNAPARIRAFVARANRRFRHSRRRSWRSWQSNAGGQLDTVMQETRLFPPPPEFAARAKINSLAAYEKLVERGGRRHRSVLGQAGRRAALVQAVRPKCSSGTSRSPNGSSAARRTSRTTASTRI